VKAIIDFIDASRDRYVAELADYLAIPSVSALPVHAADMRRCADWTAAALRRAGLQNVQIIETPGNPIVHGDWLNAPGAPTILCYGHYDVQPVDPIALWESPPFEAAVRNGKIYARGATDDKGQLLIHVKAIEAHLTQTGCLPVNIKMIIEGEEEVGGEHLSEFVHSNAQRLAADVVVNSDNAMFAADVPSITYALRGIACFQLDLRGSATDLHSGSFGGAVANPAFVLAQLLAQLKDESGRVTIPGFYDDVRSLTDEERTSFAKLPFDECNYAKALGAPELFGEQGFTTLERVWARPTLEINGLLSGFTGDGFKTVIPAVAMAKLSMRLVPNQDPDSIGDVLETYMRMITPKTVHLRITRMHGGESWMESLDSRFLQATARAMEFGFGKPPTFTREGGSNPIVPVFQRVLGAPTVMFGIGLPDENAHAPNEHLDLANFHKGIIAAASLYDEIGKLR
jgi:acetylornithine deacetylase/succinyl-diaminopimelate desuccinylase-like protein